MGSPARLLAHWKLWTTSLLGGAIVTALSTAQSYASRVVEGLPARWAQIFPIQGIDWFAWGLLAPLVIATAAALPWGETRRTRVASIWVALAFVFAVAHSVLEVTSGRAFGLVSRDMPLRTMLPARAAATLAINLIVCSMLVLSYYAAAHYRQSREREQRASVLEARLAEAQLESLRRQLQPHFLFNALHTVSALISDDVSAARHVLTRLGDLLRLSLAHSEKQEVPLARELGFLDAYLDIQRARFPERLTVRVDVPAALESAIVPSLILQPLVENSIRHAIEPLRRPGSIEVRAVREGDRLHLSVRDDGPGLHHAGGADGVGLANTRARLEHLYGPAQSLRLSNAERGGARVDVTLPLRFSV
jgi:two-component system LytT family sensor kinase